MRGLSASPEAQMRPTLAARLNMSQCKIHGFEILRVSEPTNHRKPTLQTELEAERLGDLDISFVLWLRAFQPGMCVFTSQILVWTLKVSKDQKASIV